MVVTAPKIKVFFQLTPAKMDDVLHKLQLDADYVEKVKREVVERQREIEAAKIDDFEVNQCLSRYTCRIIFHRKDFEILKPAL